MEKLSPPAECYGKAYAGHAALEIPLQAALGNEQALDCSDVGEPGQRLALENQALKQGTGAPAAERPALPGTCRLPHPRVVTRVVLLCSAAAENHFRLGEDKGGVKKHPEGLEECRQGDFGENIVL